MATGWTTRTDELRDSSVASLTGRSARTDGLRDSSVASLTHRTNVLRLLGVPLNSVFGIEELAYIYDLPSEALQEVYNRGIGAWKTNPQSVRLRKDFSKNPNMSKYPRSARLTKEQWGMARLYSFLDKGKTYQTADADIARAIGY
jgi:hypothetical protein